VVGGKRKSVTYLEKRLRIRPAGVLQIVSKHSDIGNFHVTYVSKKLIGDLNMAKAIISCSLREACIFLDQFSHIPVCGVPLSHFCTHLDGAEDPENQCLQNNKGRRTDTQSKVDTNVFPYIRIATRLTVGF
jgi:hypothetical protein